MGITKDNTERRLRKLEQMGFGDAADYIRKISEPIFECAVCGKPCRWIDRDENHPHQWGFFCEDCGVFSESDVEIED